MAESIKSIFRPEHPEKYIGDPNNIVCRSSWERIFCKWCDRTDDVLRWASEEFSIKYLSPKDNKIHRYYPDFLIEFREASTGKIKKQIIEIKPEKQTKPPIPGSRKTKTFLNESITYQVNLAKWAAAEEFCRDNGIEFRIITENELGIKSYGTRRLPNKRYKQNRKQGK